MSKKRDEQGSMIIAVIVVMILGLLSVAVAARTLSGLTNVRRSQNFSAALAQADAGVSDALFKIDQLGTGSPSLFCVGSSPTCTFSSVPNAPGAQYVASPVDSRTVIVKSKGTINGVSHGIQATVVRDQLIPFAVFGQSALRFNGSSNGTIDTVDASGNPISSPPAATGTNGTLDCTSGSTPAPSQVYYPGGSNNCGGGVAATGVYDPQDPVLGCPAAEATPATPCVPLIPPPIVNPCPIGGGGTITSPLAPGKYLCTSSIEFLPDASFTVGAGTANGGVVELYIIPPAASTANITMRGSRLNPGGDPTKFRIYMAGAGQVIPGGGSNAATFTGIMWAPTSNMTSEGCQVVWTGAIIFNTVTCNGGPNLVVHYDVRVAGLLGDNWSVKDVLEIPSTSVVLP